MTAALDLDLRRRFFADELEAVAKLRSPRLVDAFATVPRERFLPPVRGLCCRTAPTASCPGRPATGGEGRSSTSPAPWPPP